MGSDRGGAARASLRTAIAGSLLLLACSPSSGTVLGVVTGVQGDLASVQSFTLLVEGDSMTFVPAEDGDFAYPLTHLRDHLRDGTPIRVTWERADDRLLAVAVDDG